MLQNIQCTYRQLTLVLRIHEYNLQSHSVKYLLHFTVAFTYSYSGCYMYGKATVKWSRYLTEWDCKLYS